MWSLATIILAHTIGVLSHGLFVPPYISLYYFPSLILTYYAFFYSSYTHPKAPFVLPLYPHNFCNGAAFPPQGLGENGVLHELEFICVVLAKISFREFGRRMGGDNGLNCRFF